ncbi:MAG: RecX family transcriptional regulator [Alphaproteobacteria bacterium]|nr:RecX family transcriptional regulator [Alphaproteobacteria bacterium]
MSIGKATSRKPAKPGPRTPRRITPERMANIALHYLERYASSAENLRRVLERRVYKASLHHPDMDAAAARGWIEDLIARYRSAGLLDDAAYAENRARSLMARGLAARSIRMKLLEKGVGSDDIDAALAALTEETADPELHAAVKLARRRRLGPYTPDADKRAERRDRDLAALARAGFSYDMARRVVDADDPQELEELIAPPPWGVP